MKKKNEGIAGKIILILAIISFLITMLEGFFHYASFENNLFRFLLMIQNSIKAFGFRSTISIESVFHEIESKPGMLQTVICYAYCVAYFIAPFCTVATLYKIFEKLLKWNTRFFRKKSYEHIIIFGYNEDVKALIANKKQEQDGRKRKIHWVTKEDISSAEELKLMEKDVAVHEFDCLSASPSQLNDYLKEMEIERAKVIILFEESSSRNFSLYQMFHSDKLEQYKLAEGVKFFCRCEDAGIEQIMEDYYDVALEKEKPITSDLEIISIPELQVRKMFRENSLHYYYEKENVSDAKDWNVHMLILGFGRIGQQILLQAMNQGVVHSENRIVIDVLDYHMEDKKSIFSNHFSSRYFQMNENEFVLDGEASDGSLCIRFHQMDIRYKQFRQKIEELGKEKFTYIAICMKDTDTSMFCMAEMKRYLQENDGENVPIIMRLDNDRPMAEYIKNNQDTYKNVFVMEERKNAITLDEMIDEDIDVMAKRYNDLYEQINLMSSEEYDASAIGDNPEDHWKKLKLFRRNSSRALAYHASIKQLVIKEEQKKSLSELFGKDGTLLKEREKGWVFESSEEEFLKKLNSEEYSFVGEMAKMEHRRWNYFMAANGWRYAPVKKNDKLRTNPYMVNWARLCEEKPEMCKYDLMPLLVMYKEE